MNSLGLRPSTAEVGGRAVIGRTNTMTGSNIGDGSDRKTTTRRARAATDNPFAADTTPLEAPSSSEDLAACSASYFDCLNQFCNVLDQNQKQCSCSGRLSQYKRAEESLQSANEELNKVANQIRYIGLSADEVRSIMKETEAEMVLSSMDDRTQSRRMLEEIEKIIRSPAGDVNTNGGNSIMKFELDFSGGGGFDINSIFGGNDSFANMRGTELYGAAKKKCTAILARCAPKKADQGIITGQYDIEIDKACINYESGLKKATDNVKSNVRAATQMLQTARLTVLENHNLYDAKGCVSALDSCMKDDMVCGGNYYKCLDPTKTAINESGAVIPGGDVVKIQDYMRNYDNSQLDSYDWSVTTVPQSCEGDGKCIIAYLLGKIGKSDGGGKVLSGFCRPVLDKCRQYTYNSSGRYVENNTIVKSYIERVMTQIRGAQSSIISEYAGTCIHDVSACYNSQLTQVNSYSGGMNLSPTTLKPILMGACRNVALSCAYAVFSGDEVNCPKTMPNSANTCIDKLSEMFYQAMLCPANSTWTQFQCAVANPNPIPDAPTVSADLNSCPRQNGASGSTAPVNGSTATDITGYVNSNCICHPGYVVSSGQCVLEANYCPANSIWTESTGNVNTADGGIVTKHCQCNAGFTPSNGQCAKTNNS
jgi:hypothetical protein